MAVCYDTNVLLLIARDQSPEQRIRLKVNPDQEQEIVSIVTVAELRSLVKQNGWGEQRMAEVESLINKLIIVRIDSDLLIDRYVEIDVFSQNKNPNQPLPEKTPRNVGKNDLWIAATASLFNLKLPTTDNDFGHIDGVFGQIKKFELPL